MSKIHMVIDNDLLCRLLLLLQDLVDEDIHYMESEYLLEEVKKVQHNYKKEVFE